MRRHHHVTLLISVLLLMGAGITGYTLARGEPRLREQSEATQAAAAGEDNVKISRNATMRWVYEYEMCTHTVTAEATVDEELAGLTFTQLQQKYPKARIVSFDSKRVELKMRYACYCPEHYILKKHDNELAIFCTKSGTDEQRVFRLIHIGFDSIEEGEQEVLETGRVFDSAADAQAYLNALKSAD